jgi:hypothetical protein
MPWVRRASSWSEITAAGLVAFSVVCGLIVIGFTVYRIANVCS